ncbi:7-deoxyloganetin glucosyltransferase-like [Humulus lupulus]|uniref:7-deoxyloganetin glucosyltransferase-like n=1 Tax=Humulus lupulus TaxID=3486 RepID=UPI002B411C9A|nr:7-deoxyloganetin glucosyltransferase-like [Humulus lupulus]
MTMETKPHAVCIPYPAQGHINPMLKLAKLLHQRGFHITFVNTHFNHNRLLKSRGPNSLDGLPDFRFESIPDGLPPTENKADATQDIPSLCESTEKTCLDPFRKLLFQLNDASSSSGGAVPPVSCVVSDPAMPFTLTAGEEFGIPVALFWTISACGLLGYTQYENLVNKGFTPFKDESSFTNGYLDTLIDWIPAVNDIRLKDLPSFIRTTNPNEFMVKYVIRLIKLTSTGNAMIFNTFDSLEHNVLEALSSMFPCPIYTLGPLHVLVNKTQSKSLSSIASNLWVEELECLQWLDSKDSKSIVYVNFGSITAVTPEQLVEFAWGLANSKKPFVWIIRPDLVDGDSAILPSEFVEETRERSLISSWCPQEEVLSHPAIGGFLTHCGWNSTLESLSEGVPTICWPFFAEQQTNCKFLCDYWGSGMEINPNVKRDDVEKLVRELMDGEKGNDMRNKAMEWKHKAHEATELGGSSLVNLDNIISKVLVPSSKP